VHPILKLISQGEGETLDFKKIVPGAQKIAKTIVSFANTRGGTLFIGVNDNGLISGVRSQEEKYVLETAITIYCKPEIRMEIHTWEIQGKEVLEARIFEGEDKPYYAKDEDEKWWAYVRVRDESILASKIVLDVMRKNITKENTLIEYGSKEQALFKYLNENHRITLKQYCKLLNISRWRAQRILVNLISAGIIRIHDIEKEEFYTF
jgi:predicted HTH transcriptional regulator